MMHRKTQEKSQGDGQAQPVFDPEEAAAMLGLTAQQKRLADALLKGATQAQAAIEAGYSAKYASSAGNKAANSSAVQSYLAWARAGGYGVPDDTASDKELKRILTKQARGSGPNATRAAELLLKFNKQDRDDEAAKPLDPLKILAGMLVAAARANLDRAGAVAFVRALAEQHGLSWDDVQARVPKSELPAATATDVARGYRTDPILDQGNHGPQSSTPTGSPCPPATGGAGARPHAAPPSHDRRPEAPSFGLGPVKVFGD